MHEKQLSLFPKRGDYNPRQDYENIRTRSQVTLNHETPRNKKHKATL